MPANPEVKLIKKDREAELIDTQSVLSAASPETVYPTVSDLMNVRRKALALTAEIDKILGLKKHSKSDRMQR